MLGHRLLELLRSSFALSSLAVHFTSARRRLAAVLGHLRRSGWYRNVRKAIVQLIPLWVCAATAWVAGDSPVKPSVALSDAPGAYATWTDVRRPFSDLRPRCSLNCARVLCSVECEPSISQSTVHNRCTLSRA